VKGLRGSSGFAKNTGTEIHYCVAIGNHKKGERKVQRSYILRKLPSKKQSLIKKGERTVRGGGGASQRALVQERKVKNGIDG